MQLEAGKYYRDAEGCKWLCVTRNPLTICDYDLWICVSAGGCVGLYGDCGVADDCNDDCNLVAEWTDPPATQPARPPLDLSKPIVRVDDINLMSVKSDGSRIKYYHISPSSWYTCDLDGYSNGVQVLRQAVAKPWTQADVPFPWPVLRRKGSSDQHACASVNLTHVFATGHGWKPFEMLASDFEYTTDGKTWKECCKWE